MFKTKTFQTLISFSTSMLIPTIAFAAGDAEWAKPVTGMIEILESGLVQIGIPVVGIAVLIYGISQLFVEQLNLKRVGVIIFAGLCISIGPATMLALLSSA